MQRNENTTVNFARQLNFLNVLFIRFQIFSTEQKVKRIINYYFNDNSMLTLFFIEKSVCNVILLHLSRKKTISMEISNSCKCESSCHKFGIEKMFISVFIRCDAHFNFNKKKIKKTNEHQLNVRDSVKMKIKKKTSMKTSCSLQIQSNIAVFILLNNKKIEKINMKCVLSQNV